MIIHIPIVIVIICNKKEISQTPNETQYVFIAV